MSQAVLEHAMIVEEMTAVYCYCAYGLRIRSELPLPELAPASAAEADVVVRLGPVAWRPPAGDHYDGYVCGDEQAAYIYVDEVGAYAVRDGCEITIDPLPDATDDYLRVFLLGGALGLLLHQRGRLVLHASAVGSCGGAVAFLGNSGEGKSTTAAALHARGYAMLADDMVALDMIGVVPQMAPGFPRLKVWPEVAAVLGLDMRILHEFNADDERRDWRSERAYSLAPLPLRRIYVLEEADPDDAPAIERLSAQDAFATLIQYSYAVGLLGAGGSTPGYLRQCVALAGSVPIYLISRPRRLADLPRIAALIDEHIAAEDHADGPS